MYKRKSERIEQIKKKKLRESTVKDSIEGTDIELEHGQESPTVRHRDRRSQVKGRATAKVRSGSVAKPTEGPSLLSVIDLINRCK